MKSWTAADSEKVEEIKVALLVLAIKYRISYSEEMEWLDNLKYRE